MIDRSNNSMRTLNVAGVDNFQSVHANSNDHVRVGVVREDGQEL